MYRFESAWALLSNREQKRFDSWLPGVLGGTQSLLQDFYTYWRQGMTPPQIAERLNVPAEASARKLQRLGSDLQTQLERYLGWLAYEERPDLQRSLLLETLIERNARDLLDPVLKKQAKARKKEAARDQRYYQELYTLTYLEQAILARRLSNFRKGENLASKRIHSWLDAQLFDVLPLAIAGIESGESHMPDLGPLIDAHPIELADWPVSAQLTYAIYTLFRDKAWEKPGQEQDREIIRQLMQQQGLFEESSFAILQLHFTNYLIRKSTHFPDQETYANILMMSQWALQEGLWLMNRQTYRTIHNLYVNLILLSRETSAQQDFIQRAKDFLETYKTQLPEAEQAHAYAFCLKNLAFAQKQYDQIALIKSPESFNDPYYDLGYAIIQLKAQFETGEWAYIDRNLDGLEQKCRRSKGLSDTFKTGFQYQIRILRKILDVRYAEDAIKLLETVRKTRPLEGRVWIHLTLEGLIESLPSS